jgi:quinol monooxygenase YgiN
MTVEYIRYKITTDKQKQFIQAIENACEILAAHPDCLNYQLSHCEEDRTNFIWRIEWTSVDRHLNWF